MGVSFLLMTLLIRTQDKKVAQKQLEAEVNWLALEESELLPNNCPHLKAGNRGILLFRRLQ
jgi:hypothetical protein